MDHDLINTVRHYARDAINGFGTLDADDAVANALSDLDSILRRLDRADDAVGIFFVEAVEVRGRDETLSGDDQGTDGSNLKVMGL